MVIRFSKKITKVVIMPRYARRKSNSEVYHVMLRGINRMLIFYDDDDRTKFLETMDRMKKEGEFEIYAYCLMDNHIHLLIKEGEDTVQRALKRIGVSYAYYFNKKYARVGHVFQDRFRSEAIEDESYLMTAARYIHNNPVQAGIVERAGDYRWSSYREYLISGQKSRRVNVDVILEMFSRNERDAVVKFAEFTNEIINESTTEEFIDIDNTAEKPEMQVRSAASATSKSILEELLKSHGYRVTEFRNLKDKVKRDEILREIKEKSPMSIREMAKMLGISKDIIFRA
jgi:REP element-mobilizing transposase RayT